MKFIIRRVSLDDIFVCTSLFLFITVNLFSTTFFAKYIPGTLTLITPMIVVMLLLTREVINNKFTMQTVIAISIFVILISSVFFSEISSTQMIYTILIIFFLRDYPFDKTVNFVLPLTIIIFVFTIISSKIGIIQDYVEFSVSRTRHYLGFRYSLFPSTVMLNITAMSVFKNFQKEKIWRLILLFVSVYLIFVQTNSRLAFISSLLLILMAFVNKMLPDLLRKNNFLLSLLTLSYLYAFFLSYFLTIKFRSGTSWTIILNRFLGGRLYFASRSLALFGVGVFGKDVVWVGNGLDVFGQKRTLQYLYVDNLYIQLLQRYGIIFLSLFIVLFTLTMLYLYRTKQYLLLLIMSLLAFHASIDDLIMNLHYNIFLLLLSKPFISSEKVYVDE